MGDWGTGEEGEEVAVPMEEAKIGARVRWW
jgi:hypothetical protein